MNPWFHNNDMEAKVWFPRPYYILAVPETKVMEKLYSYVQSDYKLSVHYRTFYPLSI